MPANPIGLALRKRRAGQDKLLWANPELQAPESFILTSPAFEHQAPIPDRHRGRLFGENISPALTWTTPPTETAELILVVQDADAPSKTPPTHALTAGIAPSITSIPENGLTNVSPVSGLRAGRARSGAAAGPALFPYARTGPTPTSSSSSLSTTRARCTTGSGSLRRSRPWLDMS